ncbi:hypothetical protein LEMLEM_LOCUS20947 [Lemmus lemmus]
MHRVRGMLQAELAPQSTSETPQRGETVQM